MSSYTKEQSMFTEIFIPALKGLAVSVIAAAILLFALTAVTYGMEDPDSALGILGYAALYISSAVAGGVASRLTGDTGGFAVLSGAVSGAMLLAILILMSFLPAEASADSVSPLVTVLMYAAVPAVAAMSGAVLKRKPHRKIKHKRRR